MDAQIEKRLRKYRYLWTTLRDRIALFSVECYGEKEHLIYYPATKRIQLIEKSELGQALVETMLENGVMMLQDPPEELKTQRETVQTL